VDVELQNGEEVSALKIRVKFSKHGPVKYVGHLDMMRYFQKANRRAQVDICYSEGYSPHQIMSFASPLGVGMESDAEYFDMQVHSSLSSEEEIKRLNAVMAEGIQVTDYVLLPDNAKKSMTVTAATDYELLFRKGHELPAENEMLADKLEEFLAQQEIIILKKTKKSEKLTDIRPLIYSASTFEPEEDDRYESIALRFRLASESGKSLNVKLFMESLYKFCGREYDSLAYQTIRKEVYMFGEDGKFFPLITAGSKILEAIKDTE
jgi:radical SAM-linked protein